jgi:hypothetical protein
VAVRRDQPYLYPTWLAKAMAGEVSCDWATWYRVHFRDWSRPPTDFDEAKYTMEHTRLSREMRAKRDLTSEKLFVERQGSFWYTHPTGIRISGTPDLVSLSPQGNCIYEAKAFTPRAWHQLQTMIYMYCLPRSESRAFFGKTFSGQVHYSDHTVDIQPGQIEGSFEEQFNFWLDILARDEPLEKLPSQQECGYCNIGKPDCPERLAIVTLDEN